MNATQFKFFVMFFLGIASHLFSQNDLTNVEPNKTAIEPPFVGRIEGAGAVINAIQTRDGNYITLSSDFSTATIVRKSTAGGKRVWEKSLSFENVGGYFYFPSIAETNTGYVLVGWIVGSFYGGGFVGIVFLHSDGSVKARKIFNFGYLTFISFDFVIPISDGGFIEASVVMVAVRLK